MPTEVACQCGQRFAAADHLAGKTVPCPVCGRAISVPHQAPVVAPLEDLAGQSMAQPVRSGQVPLKRVRWSPTMQFLSRHWVKLVVVAVASVAGLVTLGVVIRLSRDYLPTIVNKGDDEEPAEPPQ